MRILEDEQCPVSLEVLGRFYRLPEEQITAALSTFSPLSKARLALFCIQRAHLRPLGLFIAASCEFAELSIAGGKAGAALFEIARTPEHFDAEPETHHTRGKRKITLATRAA